MSRRSARALTGRWVAPMESGGGGRPALVMGAAVGLIAFRIAGRRSNAVLGGPMRLPSARHLDRRLVLGSLAFGVGWGLAGFCPGPALVALGAGEFKALVFTAAMLAGMGLFELLEKRRAA